jgi:hypothetical protein
MPIAAKRLFNQPFPKVYPDTVFSNNAAGSGNLPGGSLKFLRLPGQTGQPRGFRASGLCSRVYQRQD